MNKVKICAECSCNHQGSLSIAKDMIREAKVCGCDYVKFQKRDIASIPAEIGDRPYLSGHSFGATYIEHRVALELKEEQWRLLQNYAQEQGIGFFGTAFDLPSAEFLCSLNLPYLKIGSGQVRDLEFIGRVANIKNIPPIIMSTGMCEIDDISKASQYLHPDIICHTTSSYPCPETEVNLRWIEKQKNYGIYLSGGLSYETGLSGHYSSGNGAIEAAAVALGATYIERHFTLDRTWKGTDQAASLEPIGMMNVVKAVRTVERAMGDGVKRVMPSEIPCLEKITGRKYT